jgi:preprotein translocase SecE subunit
MGDNVGKQVALFFIGVVVVCAIPLKWVIERIVPYLPWAVVFEASESIPVLVALVISAGIAFFLWKKKVVHDFVTDVVVELHKVTWPSRKDVQGSTIVVIIGTLLLAVILFIFDYFWSWAIRGIINLGS